MPISDNEWKKALNSSREDPIRSDTSAKSDIARFLDKHSDQAFTLNEITENIDSPLSSNGTADGAKAKVKGFLASAGEKRMTKYFLNQLVAEGHVKTKIVAKNNTEKIYYRIDL